MTNTQTAIHGRFEVTSNGNVLVSHTWGPFNVECIHAYRDHLDHQVKSLTGKRWAMLAVAYGTPIHTPESMAEMISTIQHQRKLGRCATAIVFIDVEAENIVKSMLTAMYEKASEPFIFASDEATAMTWLEAQIANAENT
jgi:hypothetical protein